LEWLLLCGNNITHLTPNCFPNELTNLSLNINKFSNICEGCFPPQLKKLWLVDSEMKKIIQNFIPQNLETLYLNNNKVSVDNMKRTRDDEHVTPNKKAKIY